VLPRPAYALSVRQPWAALIVAGRKTVEVRKWPTSIRGRVFIHAARSADNRPEAWAQVSDDLRPLAALRGGLIGAADLTGCTLYRTAAGFAADAAKHRNDPGWFQAPHMYGFTFRQGRPGPFVPCKGRVRFFRVEVPEGA
jgi:ASCH domain